jgi:Flp pilus assembly CpaF family ATPase
LISGGLGSGKTTLLNVLARQIPLSERICLLEFPPEIQLPHVNKVRLQASDELDFAVLIKKAVLRLGPHRIILGEVRGEEAFDLLRALNLGLRGGFATIHADSAEEALYTLANLARAIHYVVHVARAASGKRQVVELLQVGKYDAEAHQFLSQSLYSIRS